MVKLRSVITARLFARLREQAGTDCERLELRDGRMQVPRRPGLGLTLSERAVAWTVERAEVGRRP